MRDCRDRRWAAPLAATVVAAALVAVPRPAEAQCCLGAQDVAAESAGSRYRVEATSLTGTGFYQHGPYHYRFRWLTRTPDGSFVEQHAFEVRYDTDAHFSMRIYVSPIGNGFLLATSIADRIVFYAPAGEPVLSYARESLRIQGPERGAREGFYLRLLSSEARTAEGGVLIYDPAGYLMLSLGSPVDERLDRQIVALLAGPDRADLGRRVERLDADDPATREEATRTLTLAGMLVRSDIEARAQDRSSPEAASRARRILEALGPWRTVDAASLDRDLVFLSGLLAHPAEAVVAAARARLAAILPPAFDGSRAWVDAHASALRWDEGAGRYVPAGG